MKLYQIQSAFGIDNLAIAERPEPQPGPGQVLLKMLAYSLNYRDLLVVKGLYNSKLKLPFTPLSDGVGKVAAIGDGVRRVKVGDRVCPLFMQQWLEGQVTDAKSRSALGGGGDGVLAEYAVFHEDGVIPVPAHLSDPEAATLPCAGLTAWHALVTEGKLTAGDVVLTQGTGGVSLFALQFARLVGARVIATSSSEIKLARALHLGASDGINYKTTPEWGDKARELSGGTGVDHVIEVGGAGTIGQSLRAVRANGRISLIGILSGTGAFNLTSILMRNLCIQGIFVGSREMFEAMNKAIALHRMHPVIDRVFDFSEVPDAFRHMESATHIGKICIETK
ncbi:MAG TPA: NAD(P)-dependent alcohol dehydrogenase [Gemmataceae bacterium]|nr:NAD(P)-dependent alcohol dehydrogenase [Gemmataceae bacterium]